MTRVGNLGSFFFFLVVVGAWGTSPDILRRVTISGNALFKEELTRTVASLENQPYNPEALQRAIDAMMEYYRTAGYRFAKVMDVVPRLFDDGYYVGVTISEGRIADIRVEGLTKTREEVVLQQLLLRPGMIYREEDALESERILRTRPYLGEARIEAQADPETNLVHVIVRAEDLWSFVPRFRLTESEHGSLKQLLDGHLGFVATVTDSNVFGSGQTWKLLYQHQVIESPEEGKQGRGRLGIAMVEPNLFRSRWQFSAEYQQLSNTDRESWEIRLAHPFYSLQTTWGIDLRAFETSILDDVRYKGNLIRRWERHITGQYASVTRAFGVPRRQIRLSFWLLHQDTSYALRYSSAPVLKGTTAWALLRGEQKFEYSPASRPFESAYLAGSDLTVQSVRYVEEMNVDRLGRTEDIALGKAVTFSFGMGSRRLGNVRDEIRPALLFGMAKRHVGSWIWDARLTAATAYVSGADAFQPTGVENATIRGQTRFFLRRDAEQMLAARLEITSGHRTTDEFALFLDDFNGVRGYPRYAFDGEHRFVLNVEARQILWKRPSLWFQGVLFSDAGAIWRDVLRKEDLKRTVGIGVRLAFLRFADSPIVRLDAVYPLDRGRREWVWSVGTGQYF